MSEKLDHIIDDNPEYIEHVYEFTAQAKQKLMRVDTFLANLILNATRNRVQNAIDAGNVTVNGKSVKKNKKIHPGDVVVFTIMKPPPIDLVPQDIPIEIVYEDEFMLVGNKPPFMCSHPGLGNRSGTLINAILYHLGHREKIEIDIDEEDEFNEGAVFASDAVKPGLVHRLDKNTSGLLIVSKDSNTLVQLQKQFVDRTISREYHAIVWGNVKEDSGSIEGDIGRSPRRRKFFAVVKKGGKYAKTNYEVIERFGIFTLLKLKLETGRTHQIRVHCANIGHTLLGDFDYGGDKILKGGENQLKKKIALQCLSMCDRQMLHARRLSFFHPHLKETINLDSKLPDDFQAVLDYLRSVELYS